MPARDIFHDIVKNALIKDGWTITDDPLRVNYGLRNMFIDLGAEKLLSARKGNRKIAVEVKSFVGKSEVDDLENACGQYLFYRVYLKQTAPDRMLYLAISEEVWLNTFADFGRPLLEEYNIALIIFHEQNQEILKWMP